MCVIIHKPSDVHISDDMLKACWKTNPHGAGLMFSDDHCLVIQKGYMTFEDFLRAYRLKDEKLNMVIHFRLASCGQKNPEQTHPISINKELAFVHNGHMLNSYITEDVGEKSDSIIFSEKILTQLPDHFLSNKAIHELLSNYVKHSVFVFMDNVGAVTIIGDQEHSIEFMGCWFSNSYWFLEVDDNINYQ